MGRIAGVGVAACVAAFVGCTSSGGAGGSGAVNVNDGGSGPRPGEMCVTAATCGAVASGRSYQQCTLGSGATCTQRYLTSDGASFPCASCVDCQAAAAQVGTWCGGSMALDGGVVTTPPDDSMCATLSTANACIDCCNTAHTTGSAYFTMIATSCLCTSPGLCKRYCKNEVCTGQPITSGDNCDQCVSSELDPQLGSCADVQTMCDANTDCAADTACVNACPTTP